MPKMKSNRAAMKRFKTTAKGKVKRKRAYAGHMFKSKSPDQKRRLRKAAYVAKVDEKRVKRMILA